MLNVIYPKTLKLWRYILMHEKDRKQKTNDTDKNNEKKTDQEGRTKGKKVM